MQVNMEIIIGKTAGFCYGVKRAVEGCINEIENAKEKIYCLGEIVHNKQVVEELERKGIQFIEDMQNIKGKVIIRAHGIKKELYELAKKNNINIKDYTCPKVLNIHSIVEDYAKRGFYIVLTGSSKHPENIGTVSYAENNYFILENKDNIKNLLQKIKEEKIQKVLLISQTTYNLDDFLEISKELKERIPKEVILEIKNTICNATKSRQEEVSDIAKKVDKMIIIGGKNSSNTKKLFDIASKHCDDTICIETYKEIEEEDFNKYNKIGIMAGASTPEKSIEDVKEIIKHFT